MRLLDTTTREIHYFQSNPPAYAILSHTWAEEEVTFEELNDPASKQKLGYRKIQQFCARAKADGYQYAWIDTCCIDKRSSAELSENINSMFRYYKQAAVCYAYLADVTPGDDPRLFNAQLRSSRWFTRAWCLQELLAPATIVFLGGVGWRDIGTKDSLKTVLESITASVAQKFSWAANRQATRTEDIAYSLLGIVNVTMPLLYGEGSNAFVRLGTELLRTSNEHTIFAWMQPTGPIQLSETGLLATSPAVYAGCGDITQDVKRRTPPHTVTNVGLSITLPIVRTLQRPSDIFLAYLDCSSSRFGRICLYVHRRQESHFSRLGIGVSEEGRNWAQRTAMIIDITLGTYDIGTLFLRNDLVWNLSHPRFSDTSQTRRSDIRDRAASLADLPRSERTPLLETPGASDIQSHFHHNLRRFAFAMGRGFMSWNEHTWLTLSKSYTNILLVFVPMGIFGGALEWPPVTVAILNLVALIPLASIITTTAEELPRKLGPKIGGLLEETLANSIETFLSIFALLRREIALAQMFLLGATLAKLLLILSCCLLHGVSRYSGELFFSSKAAPAMCSIAAAAVSFLMIPQIMYASEADSGPGSLPEDHALMMSRCIAVTFIIFFAVYVYFRLQPSSEFLDERVFLGEGSVQRSFVSAPPALVLLFALLLTAICSEYLIANIWFVWNAPLFAHNKAFVAMILTSSIVSFAELRHAVFSAYGDNMNLGVGVIVGSGIQIPLLVLPCLVILGWTMDLPMTLLLGGEESLLLFLSVLILNYHVRDGNHTAVTGVILNATYTIIAVAIYIKPYDIGNL